MRIKVSKGSDPLGLCQYILDEQKQRESDQAAKKAPILATNMFGRTPEELAEEFRFSHDLNLRVYRTMTHYSISLAPGERVSDPKKVEISQDLLRQMEHGDCQFFITPHYDREHRNGVEHWHIATSSVDLYGKWVPDHFNYVELKRVERDLERRYGLQVCPPREAGKRVNLTTGEYRLRERTGQELPKEKLWQFIDQAVSDQPLMSLMMARLKAAGVSVRVREFEDEKRGISFGVDGSSFQGRKLERAYSFAGLQRYLGVRYDHSQDELLRQLERMSSEQCRVMVENWGQQKEGDLAAERGRSAFEAVKGARAGLPQPELQEESGMERGDPAFDDSLEVGHSRKPTVGSVRWERACFVLDYAERAINGSVQARLENDRYWTEWDAEKGLVSVIRKADQRQIAQGTPVAAAHRWDIVHADVDLEDWQDFNRRYQERQTISDYEKQQRQERDRGFER